MGGGTIRRYLLWAIIIAGCIFASEKNAQAKDPERVFQLRIEKAHHPFKNRIFRSDYTFSFTRWWKPFSLFKLFPTHVKLPKSVSLRKRGYREVKNAAIQHGIDPNFALKVAWAESGGRCGLTSHAGARGVMQVMPATGRKHGIKNSRTLYNCRTGAQTGVKELKSCLAKAKRDRTKALVCYNAGPAWLSKAKYRGRTIPRETQIYIRKILGKKVKKIT